MFSALSMLLVLALFVQMTYGQHESYISLRDDHFDMPDPKVAQILAERMNHTKIKINMYTHPKSTDNTTQISRALRQKMFESNPNILRDHRFKMDPDNESLKYKILQFELQAIYYTQERLRDLQVFVDKYLDDTRFRMAFIFGRLRAMEEELERIFSYVYNWHHMWWWKKITILETMWNYQHVLKRHVDVTYIIEHLIELHNAYMANIRSKRVDEKKNDLLEKIKQGTKGG